MLDLHSLGTNPAQHFRAAETGCTADDLGHDLHDLDNLYYLGHYLYDLYDLYDLSEVCNLYT